MAISVEKTDDGKFRLQIGDAEVMLGMGEIKILLAEIVAQMAPGAAPDPAKKLRDLLGRIKTANDVGIETLIRSANDDDVLVMLKTAEADADLSEKLYRNMSERTRKMYREDLNFRYRDDIPPGDIRRAADQLAKQAKALEGEGLLTYGG